MTSAINPNNINGAYPVAGQDNNSQGFRDNFTNTGSNFQFAADEISDLQAKVVLKAALIGQTGTLTNNMNGSLLTNAQLQDMSETTVSLGGIPAGAINLDYSLGSYQTMTPTGPIALGIINWPISSAAGTIVLAITVTNSSYTLQLPAAVTLGLTGLQGLNISTNTITFAEAGVYSFEFSSINAGTTITVRDLTRPLTYFTNPVFLGTPDTISANSNINLSTSTTILTSSDNRVYTLAVGSAGQVKILAYGNSSVGNSRVTVDNAGWKASGNGVANLSTTGSACTLQYVDSKWYCIGNNGVAFS